MRGWWKTQCHKWRQASSLKRTPQTVYEIDSLFLAAAYQYCTSSLDRLEVLSYISGVQLSPHRYLLTQLVPLRLSEQSVGGARANNQSLIQAQERLDHWGALWLGHIHSHPGTGPAATNFSLTDRLFVERLARGGIRVVGAIVARGFADEGYVRFFCDEQAHFSVKVRGNNVEPVVAHDNVFKLFGVENCDLPIPVPNAPDNRRSLRL